MFTSVAPFSSPVLHLLLTFFILRASLVAQVVKNLPNIQEIPDQILGREDPLEDRIPTPVFFGFPGGSAGNNPPVMWETWFGSWVGKIPCRRERLHTPVFWPGEFHGLYSSRGRKESDTTERLSLFFILKCYSKYFLLENYGELGVGSAREVSNMLRLPYSRSLFSQLVVTYAARASPVAQRLKHLPAMWENWVRSLGWEDPLEKEWQPTPVFLAGESHGRRSLVHGVAKSRTRLSDFTFFFFFHAIPESPTWLVLQVSIHTEASLEVTSCIAPM